MAAGQVHSLSFRRHRTGRRLHTTPGEFTWTTSPTDRLTFALDTLIDPTKVRQDMEDRLPIPIRSNPIRGPPTLDREGTPG